MNKLITILGLLIIAFLFIGQTNAQNSYYKSIGIAYNYGGILKHSSELPSIGSNHIKGFTLIYSRVHTSKNKWQQCFCFPKISFGLAYYNFGDPQMLGYSLNPFISVAPYINPKGKFHFIPRGAAGISYVSKVYDEQNNPENNFFSSHISGFLQLHLSLRYDLTSQLQISSGLSYNHISNGGLKQPNKGMNFITADFGLNYFIQKPVFPDNKVASNTTKEIDRWRYRINTSYTLKVAPKTDQFERKNTSVIGLMATVGYFIPRFSIIECGLELIADGYLKEQIRRQDIEKDHKRLGIIVGHTAKFGRLGFSTLIGVYVYSPYNTMDPLYQRYQLTYDIAHKFYIGVGLKAHRHVAELMMINVGVSL